MFFGLIFDGFKSADIIIEWLESENDCLIYHPVLLQKIDNNMIEMSLDCKSHSSLADSFAIDKDNFIELLKALNKYIKKLSPVIVIELFSHSAQISCREATPEELAARPNPEKLERIKRLLIKAFGPKN